MFPLLPQVPCPARIPQKGFKVVLCACHVAKGKYMLFWFHAGVWYNVIMLAYRQASEGNPQHELGQGAIWSSSHRCALEMNLNLPAVWVESGNIFSPRLMPAF